MQQCAIYSKTDQLQNCKSKMLVKNQLTVLLKDYVLSLMECSATEVSMPYILLHSLRADTLKNV